MLEECYNNFVFLGGMMEFGKDVEDRYSTGDLQNMFYKDDAEVGSTLIAFTFLPHHLLWAFFYFFIEGGNKSFGFGMEDDAEGKGGFGPDVGDEGILGECHVEKQYYT